MNGIEQLIDRLVDKSHTAIRKEEGDYYDEKGLLMCGKCNTAKQCEIVIFDDQVRRPYCLCECEAAKQKEAEAAAKREKRRAACFSTDKMYNWNFDNDEEVNEKASRAARNYVENFPQFLKEGRGLLFYGTVGTGKSFMSGCIANALIDKDYPVYMTSFTEIVNILQSRFEGKQEYIESFNKYALLIIDDLEAERDTEFVQEQVYNVINSRYRAGLPLIITTNLTLDELKTPDSIRKSRIYDRLLEMCFPIEMTGKSQRRQNVRDTYENTKKLLGI